MDHVCNTFNFFQGSITVNGLLVDKTDVICYKRSKTIFKRKPATKKCQIFVFDKGVVLAEMVENKLLAKDGKDYVLTHWTTFPVRIRKIRMLESVTDTQKLSLIFSVATI